MHSDVKKFNEEEEKNKNDRLQPPSSDKNTCWGLAKVWIILFIYIEPQKIPIDFVLNHSYKSEALPNQ